MENQSVNLEAMPERLGEVMRTVRESEAYPAILGAVAGGVAGALIATVIAGRVAASRSKEAVREVAGEKEESKGWSLREIVQLATIAATLIRQIQAWVEERRGDQAEYS